MNTLQERMNYIERDINKYSEDINKLEHTIANIRNNKEALYTQLVELFCSKFEVIKYDELNNTSIDDHRQYFLGSTGILFKRGLQTNKILSTNEMIELIKND